MSCKKNNRQNMRDRRDSIDVAETKLLNIITENLQRLRSVWDKVGLDEEQRNSRIFTVINHAETLFIDMVAEESEMAEKLVDTVKEYKEEINYLSKELHFVLPDVDSDTCLVDAECNLRSIVEEMRSEKQRRMKIYKQLFEEDFEICRQMNNAPYSIAPNHVPTERQLNELQFHIEQNRRDRDYRRAKVSEYKTRITRYISKLNLKPKSDVQKLIVSEPPENLPLSTDFLHELETLQRDLQGRFDLYLESVRRQIGPLKDKLENLWSICHVDQAYRDNFHHVNEEDFDEEALDLYNAELAKWEAYYRERREVLDKVDCWIRLWNEKLQYEEKDLDANRLNNRGGALLAEEKERKKLEKRLPLIQKEIKTVVDRWNAGHPGQRFLIEGFPVIEHLDMIQRDYHEKKEKEKLEKQMAKKNQLEAERLYGASPSISKRTTGVVRRVFPPDCRNKENAFVSASKFSSHVALATTRSPAQHQSTHAGSSALQPLASKPPRLPRLDSFNRKVVERTPVTLANLNRANDSGSNTSSESYDGFVQNVRNRILDTLSPTKLYKK